MTTCDHMNTGGDGIIRTCDKAAGHKGWHGQTVTLRGTADGTYRSTTNWGDDGKNIFHSKGRTDDQRNWTRA